MTTMGERLRIARLKRGLTQASLAKRVRTPITPGTIGHLESGRNENSRFIVWIAAALSVRAEWLCTGEGEMFEAWPWEGIDRGAVIDLPPQAVEDISDFIQMKISKHKKSRHKTGSA